MNSATTQSLVLHGVLAAVGLLAGSFSNELLSLRNDASSSSGVLNVGEALSVQELMHVSHAGTLIDSESRSAMFGDEGAIAGHTS